MTEGDFRFSAARFRRWPVCAIVLLAAAQIIHAQGILGANLIVNGGAEDGPASTGGTSIVASIPHWTATGTANVLSYNVPGLLQVTDPSPLDHGFQYFASGGPASLGSTGTLTQEIDVSSAASVIKGGNVKFTLSAYLGSVKGAGLAPAAQLSAAFKNSNGQTFSSAMLGPLGLYSNGMSLQQQIGLVPSSTVHITMTLTLSGRCGSATQCASGAADNLSLVLTPLGTSPGTVLGTNLIVNGGAEAGPGAPRTSIATYVPGWSTANGVSVTPYGPTGWIGVSDPGPADRGVNMFCGGNGDANSYQDLDVSAAASLIDSSQVTFEISAWLGSLQGFSSPTLTYIFYDWSGLQLAPTGQLGPTSHVGTALVEASHSAVLPPKTRRVHIAISFGTNAFVADNIAFTLAAPTGPPVITPGGVLSASAFGGFTAISPGSWIEIYGVNLASTTQGWSGSDFSNGVAPTSLAGVSVSIGGKPAFIDYVSPGQVNALVSSDAPVGPVDITLTNANGTSDGFGINVNQTEPGLLAPPSFQIGGKQYLAALFTDGTFAIPQNAIPGVASRPAVPGDTLIIYGVGFGPVNPGFSAGTVVTQGNALTSPVVFEFGSTSVTPSYAGLVPSYTGLYQFNVVVPNVATNSAAPISFTLGGVKGTQTLYIAVQD